MAPGCWQALGRCLCLVYLPESRWSLPRPSTSPGAGRLIRSGGLPPSRPPLRTSRACRSAGCRSRSTVCCILEWSSTEPEPPSDRRWICLRNRAHLEVKANTVMKWCWKVMKGGFRNQWRRLRKKAGEENNLGNSSLGPNQQDWSSQFRGAQNILWSFCLALSVNPRGSADFHPAGFFNSHFSCSPWQGPSRHGLTASGFSLLHCSPIRHVTRRLSTPSPQVTEHWGSAQTSKSEDNRVTCRASLATLMLCLKKEAIRLQIWGVGGQQQKTTKLMELCIWPKINQWMIFLHHKLYHCYEPWSPSTLNVSRWKCQTFCLEFIYSETK